MTAHPTLDDFGMAGLRSHRKACWVGAIASFTLLEAMFSSVVGNVPGGEPLLTIPIN